MNEQSRETLPVDISELERQKEIHEHILQQIITSIDDPEGLRAENLDELKKSRQATLRHIGEVVAHIARKQQVA
jgi:hypothetical protein